MPVNLGRRFALALALACAIATASAHTANQRVTLVGLDATQVEKKIGAPNEKDELADSDEAYWIYKTPYGTLSVHFQNRLVVSYSPEDFPLEKIVKGDSGERIPLSPASDHPCS
jgi:hypothetical protein